MLSLTAGVQTLRDNNKNTQTETNYYVWILITCQPIKWTNEHVRKVVKLQRLMSWQSSLIPVIQPIPGVQGILTFVDVIDFIGKFWRSSIEFLLKLRDWMSRSRQQDGVSVSCQFLYVCGNVWGCASMHVRVGFNIHIPSQGTWFSTLNNGIC